VALGKSEKDEHKANLHLLSERIAGKVNDMKTEMHLMNRPVLHELARPKQQHLYECGQDIRESIIQRRTSRIQMSRSACSSRRCRARRSYRRLAPSRWAQLAPGWLLLWLAVASEGCPWQPLLLPGSTRARGHGVCMTRFRHGLRISDGVLPHCMPFACQQLSGAMLPAAGHGLRAGGRKGHGGL